ncbi:MAG: hypothetical protein ACYTE6_10485, partial [Planctomycetota bacterium]
AAHPNRYPVKFAESERIARSLRLLSVSLTTVADQKPFVKKESTVMSRTLPMAPPAGTPGADNR